jgi:predicted GIY-YIG superfamily endonuclease
VLSGVEAWQATVGRVECPERRSGATASKGGFVRWYVYILQCSDGSYYVGHTRDVEARFTRHSAREGARYTAVHCPAAILFRESHASLTDAVCRERQVKRWSRAKKEALIRWDRDRLRLLSRSRLD